MCNFYDSFLNFRFIIVVEHDLSVLDYLSDFICCLYGVPGAYGVVTMPFSVREGESNNFKCILYIKKKTRRKLLFKKFHLLARNQYFLGWVCSDRKFTVP